MKFKLATALIAAPLLTAAVAAHANGYFVTEAGEAVVKDGMSSDDVLSAIGRPDRKESFMSQQGGYTWTYRVVGKGEPTLFDVDFDAQGHVVSTEERLPPGRG